ncbi:MAG: DUF6320 domain-containing protein [Oscillospiraceae bacterium]|nr:DUF6320 domain-containing protein [Oscillospiraceae bacterium]
MKHCVKCKVNVRTESKRCPLCQRPLTGGENEQLYPVVNSVYKEYEAYFKQMLFATAVIAIGTVSANAIIPSERFWSLTVIFGMASFWVFLLLVINKKHNIAKRISNQVFFVTIGCVAWDFFTGWKGWSLDYVFPIVCVIAVMSMFILARVMKLNARDYVVCLIADAFFGVLPLVFYFLKLTNVIYPSIVGSALSLLSLVSILIYQYNTIRLELTKRFHL